MSSNQAWRSRMGRLRDDAGEVQSGQSTESETESSYKGWSDNWRDSPDPRPSLSSGDEIQPDIPSSGRTMSMQPGPNTISHRRLTVTRPGIHTSHSNVTLDSLLPTAPPSTILNIGEQLTPIAMTSNGFQAPPPYPESFSFPRTRRKSLSVQHIQPESETSPDEKHQHASMIKGKKKKGRATSFSLPFHRRRKSNASYLNYARATGKLAFRPIVALLGLIVILGLIVWKRAYELQVELSFFSHKWIKDEFDVIMPLKGCFAPERISPQYDLERHLAPKYQVLTPGVSLKRGTACYDFSSTVQSNPDVEPEHLLYHTYWRADLIPFGERHTATLASFLATQPLTHSKLILWTNGAEKLGNNTFIRPFLEKWSDNIELRQVDMPALTRGTEIDGLLSNAGGGGLYDERAWVDGDAIRLLVLWHYGGVWMDMDQILTRDVHPLIEHEFVTQWDCYDKPYFSLNGALMHFRQHSPYLCEAFHIMATSPLPKPNTFTWGSHLYSKLHRRLLAGRQRPFTVLPWCFADPRNCRNDIRFPDPFLPDPEYWAGRHWEGRGEVGRSGRELLEEKVGYVWTVHLHNQWKKDFPTEGWVQRLLQGYKNQIDVMERYARSKFKRGSEEPERERRVGGEEQIEASEDVASREKVEGREPGERIEKVEKVEQVDQVETVDKGEKEPSGMEANESLEIPDREEI